MKTLFLHSSLYGGSTALLKLIGFVVFLWLARTLSVEEFATFGLLYAIQQAIAAFALAGIVEAVIGLLKVHPEPDQRYWLFANANFAFLLMALAAIIVTLIASAFFVKSSSIDPISYIGIYGSGLLLAWSTLQSQLIRLREMHIESLLFGLFPQLGTLLGGFVAAYIERTGQSFFIGALIGGSISVLGLWTSRIRLGAGTVKFGQVRPLLWGALPFTAVAFLGWLSGYGNNFIINIAFSPPEVAKFTFLLSLCSIMLMVAGSLNQVWCPRFYSLIDELPHNLLENTNKRFYLALSLVLGGVGGLVVVLFSSVMNSIGGNLVVYGSMTTELSLLFCAYVLLTPWWHCQNYMLANAMGTLVLKLTLLAGVVGVTFLLVLIWKFGSIGIYIGFMFQMIFRSIGIVFFSSRNWSIDISWIGVAMGVAMICLGLLLSSIGINLIISCTIYLLSILLIFIVIFPREVVELG